MINNALTAAAEWWLRRRGIDPVEGRIGIAGRFEIGVYKTSAVERKWPEWPRLSQYQRTVRLNQSPKIDPVRTVTNHNTVADDTLNATVDFYDPNTTQSFDIDELVLGTGNSTPSSGDNSLDSEISSSPFSLGTINNNANMYETSTTIGQNTANGNTIREAGLQVSASTTLVDRALVGPVDKNSSKTLTVDGQLNLLAI